MKNLIIPKVLEISTTCSYQSIPSYLHGFYCETTYYSPKSSEKDLYTSVHRQTATSYMSTYMVVVNMVEF